MGYDMYWETVPERIQIAASAARDRAIAANEHANARGREVIARKPDAIGPMPFGLPQDKQPDPELVAIENERQKAWEQFFEAEQSYFRLNIWGMSACREIMAEHDMLAYEQPESATFENVSEFPGEDHFDDQGEPLTGTGEAYKRVVQRVREETSPQPGIPLWKLCSNDDWLVLPEEIHAALAKAPEAVTVIEDNEEVTVEWWPHWLRFLRGAAENGGFRVR